MKTRIETIHVPAYSYEVTHYGCDHCEFESQDEEAVQGHHAKTHAVKKETAVNGEKLYWFESEADALLWLDPPGDYSTRDFVSVQWTGAGWYGERSESGVGRCRCGGCHYFETILYPLADFIERLRRSGEQTEAMLTAFNAVET